MTTLTKPVRRKITTARGEPLVIIVTPEGLYFREPRRRKAFLLPYGDAFMRAVRIAVEAERKEKAAARKTRKARR
jgi:bifunctional DNA-binding transcriptional regulator/antitoxin component of YhaV-PrlF toxin-antitoxin module